MSTKSKNLKVADQIISAQVRVRTVTTSANFSEELFNNFEYPEGVSETVPDMTVDLRLMLNRQASGMAIPYHEAPYAEEDYPDFFKMDEFELAEYRLDLAHKMKDMENELHISSKKLEELQEQQRKNAVTKQQQKDENPPKPTGSDEPTP